MLKKVGSLLAVIAFAGILAACEDTQYNQSSSKTEQAATEKNQQGLRATYPIPQLTQSEELKNLSKRAERLNTENMTGCIYLINYGAVMAFYPVRGKVTSLNAYMTGREKIIDDPNGTADVGSVLLESPDIDGAYGQNADGIFFFTADSDAYVEWKGDYMWSDQCMKLNQQPLMVRNVGPND